MSTKPIANIEGFTYENQPVYGGRRLSVLGFHLAVTNGWLLEEAHERYEDMDEAQYDELTEEVTDAE